MGMAKCDRCENPYLKTHNSQLYCNKRCAGRSFVEKKKLRQQKENNTLEPRQCKRCHKDFHFHGMKKYCLDCLEFLSIKPQAYKKNNKDYILPELCTRCHKNPKRSNHSRTKYCEECAKEVAIEKSSVNNARQKEMKENGIKPIPMRKGDIDPKWLLRGPISDKGQK